MNTDIQNVASACIGIMLATVIIVCLWRIVSRTGMSGAVSILLLIPLVNVVALLILAFRKWPIEMKIEALIREVEIQKNIISSNKAVEGNSSRGGPESPHR